MSLSSRLAVLCGATLAFSACGGGTTDPATGPASIRFASADTLFLNQGQTQAQPVTLADKNGNAVASSLVPVYSVVGTTITVSPTGVVTAVGPGLSTLVVTAGTLTASRTVGVYGHPAGFAMQSVVVQSRPYGLAVSGSVALVTQLDGRSVTKLNIAGPPTVVSQITVNDTPTGISVTPNGATAFVANQYDYSIGVIDVAAGQQTKKFPFQATTFRTLVSRDGSRAYWTTSGGELTSYNVSTSAIISTRSGFGIANGLALGLGDSTLFVSSMDGTLSAVDVKSGALIRSVTIPNSTLQDVAVSPAGDEIYVADERGRLLIISPALGISTALSAPGAFGVALSPDGTQLWVTQPTATTITVVDRATHTILKTITGLGWPRRVAFDRFGAAAVVTDEAGAVHVFR